MRLGLGAGYLVSGYFDIVCALGLGRSWTNEREGIYFVWEAMACGRVGGCGVK